MSQRDVVVYGIKKVIAACNSFRESGEIVTIYAKRHRDGG